MDVLRVRMPECEATAPQLVAAFPASRKAIWNGITLGVGNAEQQGWCYVAIDHKGSETANDRPLANAILVADEWFPSAIRWAGVRPSLTIRPTWDADHRMTSSVLDIGWGRGLAESAAIFAFSNQWKKAGVLQPRGADVNGMYADAFYFTCRFVGMSCHREEYTHDDFERRVKALARKELDVIYAPIPAKRARQLMSALEVLDWKVAIIGSHEWEGCNLGLDDAASVNKVYYPSVFSPGDPSTSSFATTYHDRFEIPASSAAALAFDASRMAVKALAGEAVSANASYDDSYVTGPFSFDENGNVIRRESVISSVDASGETFVTRVANKL